MGNKAIAIFLGGYLPAKKYGGPVTSISNLVENMGDEWDFYIISNDHEFNENRRLPGIQEGWNHVGKAKVLYISENKYQKKYFENVLKGIEARCIYLSSIFYYKMNLPAISAARSLNIPIIMAPRGEICEGAMKIGFLKKRAYLRIVNLFRIFADVRFHVTSDEEKIAVKKELIRHGKIYNLPNMPCAIMDKNGVIKEKGTVHIVYISRIVKKKNLLYAIEQVNNCKTKVIFDIYGPIEESEYWETCTKEIEKAPYNVKIQYMGSLEPGSSRTVFSKYDVFVFPTYSENYGHVIVEAISSGCHLIVSKGTTPWDDIASCGGYAISLEDKNEWTKAIDEIANMSESQYREFDQELTEYVKRKISVDLLIKQYSDMFSETINND